MSSSGRVRRVWWLGAAICVLGFAWAWSLLARPELERASVVLAPAAGVVAPAGRDDVFAIVYSGDGGWADLDRQLGNAFAARGIPVVGVNAFRYFWRERSPELAAAELDALMTKYLDVWHRQRVWLVGFSFGANVLPTLVDRLSAANRARIAQLVLLAPSREIGFEIQFQDYMVQQGRLRAVVKSVLEKFNEVAQHDALPALVALAAQPPVVCYYGKDEADDTLCTVSDLPAWVRVHAREGGHHFDGGYTALAAQMIEELPVRSSD